jgi:hypothetical protein
MFPMNTVKTLSTRSGRQISTASYFDDQRFHFNPEPPPALLAQNERVQVESRSMLRTLQVVPSSNQSPSLLFCDVLRANTDSRFCSPIFSFWQQGQPSPHDQSDFLLTTTAPVLRQIAGLVLVVHKMMEMQKDAGLRDAEGMSLMVNKVWDDTSRNIFHKQDPHWANVTPFLRPLSFTPGIASLVVGQFPHMRDLENSIAAVKSGREPGGQDQPLDPETYFLTYPAIVATLVMHGKLLKESGQSRGAFLLATDLDQLGRGPSCEAIFNARNKAYLNGVEDGRCEKKLKELIGSRHEHEVKEKLEEQKQKADEAAVEVLKDVRDA